MNKRTIKLASVALAISLSSCYKDDIAELHKELDNLKEEMAEMEAAQREALQNQIAFMQEQIDKLEEENGELNSDLDGLQQALEDLANEIASDEAAIFYGDLETDGDYARFENQQATVVTGNVVVRSAEDAALLGELEFVQGAMRIESELSLPLLQTVFGYMEVNAPTVAAELTTIGRDLTVKATFEAPKLAAVYGDFKAEGDIARLDMPALALVEGDFNIQAASFESYTTADINVRNDVNIFWVGGQAALSFGEVVGNMTITECEGVGSINYSGETLGGSLFISNIPYLSEVSAPMLKSVGGDFNFTNNAPFNGVLPMDDFSGFDALETIQGNFALKGNKVPAIVGFNNVTTIGGNVDMGSPNGSGLEELNVLNNLTVLGTAEAPGNISVNQRAKIMLIFESLTEAGNISFFGTSKGMSSSYEEFTEFDVLAFSSLETINSGLFYFTAVTSFDGLDNLTSVDAAGTNLQVVLPADESIELCGLNNYLMAQRDYLDESQDMSVVSTIALYNADETEYPGYTHDGVNRMPGTGWINYTTQVSCGSTWEPAF